MRVVICDDDPIFTQSFFAMLAQEFAARQQQINLICLNSGDDALREVVSAPIAVLFLDIDMPQMNGFDVAKRLSEMKNPPTIIFVSSMEQLVFESFSFRPFWFLRKSHLDELPQVVEKVIAHFVGRQQHYQFTENGEKMQLFLDDICYFESEGHYVFIHTETERHRCKARLSDIENDLKNTSFVRCHIGYIVNCRFIKIANKATLILTGDQSIPVSRSNIQKTQEHFMNYMRSLRQ